MLRRQFGYFCRTLGYLLQVFENSTCFYRERSNPVVLINTAYSCSCEKRVYYIKNDNPVCSILPSNLLLLLTGPIYPR